MNTGKEILPSNQQQMIEQAKFIYSPLVKAFKKETKTIEDQGGKQIKVIQDKIPLKSIKKYDYSINDSPMVYINLDKNVDTKKLVSKYKDKNLDKIRNGEISLNDAKDDQVRLRSKLGEIRRVQKKNLLKRVEMHETILKYFIMLEKTLLIFLMNLLQEHLKLDIKQNKEQDLKY